MSFGCERDRLNICRVRVFTSSGSTGGRGGDAKTIISPNTSFGDIIIIAEKRLRKLLNADFSMFIFYF